MRERNPIDNQSIIAAHLPGGTETNGSRFARGLSVAARLLRRAPILLPAAALLLTGWALHSVLLLILGTVVMGITLAILQGGWRAWLVLAVLSGVAAATVYGQLDGLLKGMHPFGTAHYGLADLGSRSGAQGAFDAVRSWRTWYDTPGDPTLAAAIHKLYASPFHVARLALTFDAFLLIPALALALALLISRVNRHLQPPEDSASHSSSTQSPYVRVGELAMVGVALFAVADWLEDFGYWRALSVFASAQDSSAGSPFDRFLVRYTFVSTYAKWGGLVLAIGGLLVLSLQLDEPSRRRLREMRRVVHLLRGQISLMVVLAGLLAVHPQAPDVIRRWNVRQGSIAATLAVVLAAIGWAFGRRLATPTMLNEGDRAEPGRRPMGAAGGAALIAAIILALVGHPAWGLAVPGLFWVAMAVLDRLRGHFPSTPHPQPGYGRRALPALVGVSAPALLGVAVLRASLGSFVLQKRSFEGPLVAWGVAFLVGSWALYLAFRLIGDRREGMQRARSRVDWFVGVMAIALALGVYLWVQIIRNVWAVSGLLGTIGVLEAFLIMATIVVGGLVMLAEWVEPPKGLKAAGFKRFPVFLLLAGWLLIASSLPFGQGFHDVRFLTVPAGTDGSAPVLTTAATPESVLVRWLRQQPPETFRPGPDGGRRGIPLLLVATEGGGIRSAYWTSLVLDCILQPRSLTNACAGGVGRDETGRVIAASGVSGGSVGLIEYLAHEIRSRTDQSDGPDWVGSRLGGDYLSSSLGWELAVELPRAFLRFDAGRDRAEVLERAWQQSWVPGPWSPGWGNASWRSAGHEDHGPLTQGFFDLWEKGGAPNGPTVPLLILNGTNVTDGCRFNTSALDGNGNDGGQVPGSAPVPGCLGAGSPSGLPVFPATRDLEDQLCQSEDRMRVDVRLSTAALLSARFPFVSPSGRIQDCRSPKQAAYIVDGGYLENSGAATIQHLWQALEPWIADYNAGRFTKAGNPTSTCLVPFLIQIDNGYGEPSPDVRTKRPGELTVPAKGLFSARAAITALARQDAADTFSQEDRLADIFVAQRYAHFVTHSHPGVQAPSGWVLSNSAQRDLRDQLQENRKEIQLVRQWLTGPLPCGPTG